MEQQKWYTRTQQLLGADNFNRLQTAAVAIIGVGGVGGACAEALCRAGIGRLIIMDHDTVDITNINRQLIATHDTVGQQKVAVLMARLKSINPACDVVALPEFYSEENKGVLDNMPDFVVDAIDTVSAKLSLAAECRARAIPLISSMGTGNRLDPTSFRLGTIADTAHSDCGCGLARVMRKELRRRGITDLTVLYSVEYPRSIVSDSSNGRHSPASISFCPPVAGYIIASHVVSKLMGE